LKKLAAAVALAEGFGGTGEPVRQPAYQCQLSIAMMPAGVFHYIEIEDHEDWASWTRAPHYPAALLMPDSRCDVRARALLDPIGYAPVVAGPRVGQTPWPRVIGALTSPHEVAVADSRANIIEMDFAAIAESDRGWLSFKKTAGFFG
jgi:hypothetical protein